MSKFEKIIRSVIGLENIKKIKYKISFIYYLKFAKYKKKKKIIHMLTPIHGNLGDQAIVYATNRYLKENFEEYEVIEVYKRDIYKYAKSLKMILNSDDLIFLIGGGNLGNIWLNEELERRFVIDTFKNNRIISMPQTMNFSNDDCGAKELEISKKIYNKHNRLTLIAREKKSYKDMAATFTSAKVILSPDMVFYLNNILGNKSENRDAIMTCLRNDKESILKDKREKLLIELEKMYGEIYNLDTVVDRLVYRGEREEELFNMWRDFQKSKLVITDRLHGMIFSVITNTPCIVTKSMDHKIIGCYEWIKNLNYIFFIDELNMTEIEKAISEIEKLDNINHIDFKEMYFNKLKELLMKDEE